MLNRTHRLATAIIVLLSFVAIAKQTGAQVVFSNPPCANITVNNNGPCTVSFNLITTAGTFIPINIPGFGFQLVAVPLNGTIALNGISGADAVVHGFRSPSVPGLPSCGPNDWWIQKVRLGAALTCCYDVCADPCGCTINLVQVGC